MVLILRNAGIINVLGKTCAILYKILGNDDTGHDNPVKNRIIGERNTKKIIEFSLLLNNKDTASPKNITENKNGIISRITFNKLPLLGNPNQL